MKNKKLKKIEIPEITRVEGHEAVYVEIEGDQVLDVKLDVFEGTRFFEKIVCGNHFEQMPHITSRVCAICSTGHVIAAIRALEKICQFRPVKEVELLRELMHLGMIIESNATHIFALALPDFLGFKDVYEFATDNSKEFKMWTDLRNLGSSIQTSIGGRPFHPVNLHAGGFSKYPQESELKNLRSLCEAQLDTAILTVEMLAGFTPPVARTTTPVFLALEPSGSAYGYFGERIKSTSGFSDSIDNYREYLKEETVPYSHSKRASMNGEPIMVGSMARLFLFSDRLKSTSKKLFADSALGKGDTNSIWNNLAQAIELVEAIERSIEILTNLVDSYDAWFKPKPLADLNLDSGSKGDAVGAVECPRGTLYHEYTVGDDGIILSANMITPSAQNTYRIERDISEVVASTLEEGEPESCDQALSANLETLVRAYDPCNTCATHMVKLNFKKS